MAAVSQIRWQVMGEQRPVRPSTDGVVELVFDLVSVKCS